MRKILSSGRSAYCFARHGPFLAVESTAIQLADSRSQPLCKNECTTRTFPGSPSREERHAILLCDDLSLMKKTPVLLDGDNILKVFGRPFRLINKAQKH